MAADWGGVAERPWILPELRVHPAAIQSEISLPLDQPQEYFYYGWNGHGEKIFGLGRLWLWIATSDDEEDDDAPILF